MSANESSAATKEDVVMNGADTAVAEAPAAEEAADPAQVAALDALQSALNTIGENPYASYSAYGEGVKAALELGMDGQADEVWELWGSAWALGEDDHLTHLNRLLSAPSSDAASLSALHAAFSRAFTDVPGSLRLAELYLTHMSEGHTLAQEEGASEEVKAVFEEQRVREAFAEAYERVEWDLSGSSEIWNRWRDWETARLESDPSADRISYIQNMYLARLKVPHAKHADTFQAYSTFVSTYDNSSYEGHLVSANKAYQPAVAIWQAYEDWEMAISASPTPEGYLAYLAHAIHPPGKRDKPEPRLIRALFERTVRDTFPFASSAQDGPAGSVSEERAASAAAVWVKYAEWLVTDKQKPNVVLDAAVRATRTVPWSGQVWEELLRTHERYNHPEEDAEQSYLRALSTTLLDKRTDDLVTLVSARASHLRRKAEELGEGADAVVAVLQDGIERVKESSPQGDERFRLEKYLMSWHERQGEFDEIAAVWEALSKQLKGSYLVWTEWAAFEARRGNPNKARGVYKSAYARGYLDYPEAVFQAWTEFEQLYGSLDTSQQARNLIAKQMEVVNKKRAREYQAAQATAAQGYAGAEQYAAAAAAAPSAQDLNAMLVDSAAAAAPAEQAATGTKRKAESEPAQENAEEAERSKKAKLTQATEGLKRDREGTTVIVSGLPKAVEEDAVRKLFRDCGKIREIVIKNVGENDAATVEFFERNSVVIALTRDKKRVGENEVAVHMGWATTLYITNFPEGTDDEKLRKMFSEFGTIFDTRWPSKSQKASRRFAFLQFVSADSAQASLTLNGRVQEHGHPLGVAIADPAARKQRTDVNLLERELFVRDLARKTSREDLEKLFSPFGELKDIRMGLRDDGTCKGFAHIEYKDAKSSADALSLNNTEYKSKRISVTLADKTKKVQKQSRETSTRSVRVAGLPPNAKEALIQQEFEKLAPVKRVWYEEGTSNIAVVEFVSQADASRVLLMPPPTLDGHALKLSEESAFSRPVAAAPVAPATPAAFRPRATRTKIATSTGRGRGRAGIGAVSRGGRPEGEDVSMSPPAVPAANGNDGAEASGSGGKTQEQFRKMLG